MLYSPFWSPGSIRLLFALKAFLTALFLFSCLRALLPGRHVDPPSRQPPVDAYTDTQTTLHGHIACLPPASPALIRRSESMRKTCRRRSPFSKSLSRSSPRIGIASSLIGSTPQPHLQAALRTHQLHSLTQSTPLHVLCNKLVDKHWNKEAFLLSLLYAETLKPASTRLEWIFWADSDTIILDPCRPLSTFLPPGPRMVGNETNLIISRDAVGLNDSVFFLRVCSWSIDLLTTFLAYRYFRPNDHLWSGEQAAMEILAAEPRFKSYVQYAPQYWFNAFPLGEVGDYLARNKDQARAMEAYKARRGDFLVHFEGHREKVRALTEWTDVMEGLGSVWEKRGNGTGVQRDVTAEVRRFWKERGY